MAAQPDPVRTAVDAAVDRYFRAIADRDAAAWAANFAPGGRSEDPVGGDPVVGRAQLQAFQQGIFDAFPALVLTPGERFHGGHQVAVQWTGHVESHTGASADFAGINTYEIDSDGKIAAQKAFWDIDAVQRALGS